MAVTLLTQTAYARHRRCDEKAVRKAIAAGRISTINGMIDPVVADIQWANNTRARADSARPTVPAIAPATDAATPPAASSAASSPNPSTRDEYSVDRARREHYEADMAEMKLLEQRGELVRAADVRAEIEQRFGQVRANLLQMPARLAPIFAIETDQAKIHLHLDAELRSVLGAVSRGGAPGPTVVTTGA